MYVSVRCTFVCVPLSQSGGPSITIRLKRRAWLTLRNNLIPLKTPLSSTLFFTFSIVGFLRFTFLFSPLPYLSAGFREQTSADENLPSMSAVIPQTHTCCAAHTQRTQSCCQYIVLTRLFVCVCACVCVYVCVVIILLEEPNVRQDPLQLFFFFGLRPKERKPCCSKLKLSITL